MQTDFHIYTICLCSRVQACVCVYDCTAKSLHLDGINYVHKYTHSSYSVLCRSGTGLGAASDTTLNPISDDSIPKTLAKIGFRTVCSWIAAILLYVEPFDLKKQQKKPSPLPTVCELWELWTLFPVSCSCNCKFTNQLVKSTK